MGSMIIPFIIFVIVVAVLMVTLMGGDSGKKKQGPRVIGCPPGFNPGLAYMEKYGETGIAYDETQKRLCILHQESNQSRVVSPADIVAAAFLEDGVVLAKSVRTDEQGKALLSSLLTEEIKAVFQDAPEASAIPADETKKATSQTIELKILINDPNNPMQTINFLNMEAKKGGLIYNEAAGHVKNWQDLVSFLIRQAGKPKPQTSPAAQGAVPQPESSQQQASPTPPQEPSPTAVGIP